MGASFRRNPRYRFIRNAIGKRYDKASLADIMARAEACYASLAERCEGASPGEWKHLTSNILPTAAVYKALLDVDAENAQRITGDVLLGLCRTGNRVLCGVLHIPGMKGLFMRMLPGMALSMFGRECGFDYTHFFADGKRLEMDTTVCPYCKYAALLEIEELMPVFCESDFATYGGLPGIRFTRTATLGTGGEKCDFRFTRQ